MSPREHGMATLVTLGAAWRKLGAIQAALKELTIRVGKIEAILMRRK